MGSARDEAGDVADETGRATGEAFGANPLEPRRGGAIYAPSQRPAAPEPLGGVDHDLRTLAGGVLRLAEDLLDTPLDGAQRELAQRIQASGDAMIEMLEDIRALSELSPGVASPTRFDFDLRRAVEEAGETLAADAERRGVELVFVLPPEIPGGVRGDAARLRQLLARLGVFAVASAGATRRRDGGEVSLRVELIGETAGGVSTRFTMSYVPGRDRARETPERRGVRTLDPFSPTLGGAGLGLALVKRLVEILGGELQSATDPEGRGVLWFELAFERRGRSTTRGLVPRVDLGGKRVLLVEDSAPARAAVRAMVELLATDLEVAESESEATHAMRVASTMGTPFDVVLLDATLPGGGTARVRSLAAATRTHVVLLAYPAAAASAGETVVVSKPVRVSQLHTALRAILLPAAEERAAPQRSSRPRPPMGSAPDSFHPPPHRSGAYEAVRRDEPRTPSAGPAAPSHPPIPAESSPPPPSALQRPTGQPAAARARTLESGAVPPAAASDRDVLDQVIGLVVRRAPSLVARMHAAASEGRMDTLGALAQELHDAASRLALLRLMDLCTRVVRQARAGTPESASAAVRAVEDEVERSRASVAGGSGPRRG
ncbi:uncharacterized protein CMC5_044660 [Chondromyces crocatus]|uniref:Histidine kinase n=1 Tax=Chondromyces crocatus TaxID=52 RepID=A0A0K1EI84_CHOCO|nr:uncharacterized protein CMC5_044660 [Chondromyces crocatus]